jgi:histidinol-phosphate aminotransferase
VTSVDKGGGSFAGIKLLLCENPLPPLEEAVEAAAQELPRSNFYTDRYSQPLREAIARYCSVPVDYVHINAGSEVILRQLVSRFGDRTHLVVPTFALFEQIARATTFTFLREEDAFVPDMSGLEIPNGTTLAVIVNPNNPNGAVLNLQDRTDLLECHPETMFLVDEAFIEFGGQSVTNLVPRYPNLVVTRTFSKAFSLAGFRVGYAVAPLVVTEWLNSSNDAYPLARASEAAAIASLEHLGAIMQRVALLKSWSRDFSTSLASLGIKTFPTETYFFLGQVPGMTGQMFASELLKHGVLVKALDQKGLPDNFVRFTTSTPENNAKALAAIAEVMGRSPVDGVGRHPWHSATAAAVHGEPQAKSQSSC